MIYVQLFKFTTAIFTQSYKNLNFFNIRDKRNLLDSPDFLKIGFTTRWIPRATNIVHYFWNKSIKHYLFWHRCLLKLWIPFLDVFVVGHGKQHMQHIVLEPQKALAKQNKWKLLWLKTCQTVSNCIEKSLWSIDHSVFLEFLSKTSRKYAFCRSIRENTLATQMVCSP